MSLTNATVTGNGASNAIGGGLVNQAGNLALLNVTLQDNFRGGVETGQGATTSARNTIFGKGYAVGSDGSCSHAGRNTGSGYVTGPPITSDLGHNLDEDGTCGLSGLANVDPHLAPAYDNGGPTPTAALLAGSPAIDAGNGCAATDQRGRFRPPARVRHRRVRGRALRRAHGDHALAAGRCCRRPRISARGSPSRARRARSPSPGATVRPDLTRTATYAAGVISSTTNRTARLDGLEPETTYYYQAIAENASGVSVGDVLSFTTAAAPPEVLGGASSRRDGHLGEHRVLGQPERSSDDVQGRLDLPRRWQRERTGGRQAPARRRSRSPARSPA